LEERHVEIVLEERNGKGPRKHGKRNRDIEEKDGEGEIKRDREVAVEEMKKRDRIWLVFYCILFSCLFLPGLAWPCHVFSRITNRNEAGRNSTARNGKGLEA
jgi:hypothetical protein